MFPKCVSVGVNVCMRGERRERERDYELQISSAILQCEHVIFLISY